MKRQEKTNYNILLYSLLLANKQKEKSDLAELRKPYCFKGRFNSLSNKAKKEKIKGYYQEQRESIKNELKALYNMPEWVYFSACVEWVRSSVWGYNPHAKVICNNNLVGFGSASGCGYDKLSASICYACNSSDYLENKPIIKNIILGAVVRAYCRTGKPLPYGIYKTDRIYLHFDGCGVSTLREIALYCGLDKWQHYDTKTSDFITICKDMTKEG